MKFSVAVFTIVPASTSSEDLGVAITFIPFTTLKSVPTSPKLKVIDFTLTISLSSIKDVNFEFCEGLSIFIVLVE